MLNKFFKSIFGKADAASESVQNLNVTEDSMNYIFLHTHHGQPLSNPNLVEQLAQLKSHYNNVTLVAYSSEYPTQVDKDLAAIDVTDDIDHVICGNANILTVNNEKNDSRLSTRHTYDPQFWDRMNIEGTPVLPVDMFVISNSEMDCDAARMAGSQFHYFTQTASQKKNSNLAVNAVSQWLDKRTIN